MKTQKAKVTQFAAADRKRVELVRGSGGPNAYFKRGQYGYVIAVNTSGGMHCVDKEGSAPGDWDSKPGELAYLVSKSRDMRGGALWFSAAAVRFTVKGDKR